MEYLFGGSKGGGDFRVQDQNKGSSNSTEGVGTSSLEKGANTFILHDLSEAVSSSLVDPFFLGLFRLHLKTTTDGVEGVGSVSGGNGGNLGADKLGGGTQETIFVLLVRVVSREGIEETEVDSTVGDDTDNGDSDTVVESGRTSRLDSLGQTVQQTVELLLSSTDIRSKTSTGVVERVNNHQRSGTSQTTRGHVDHEEFGEFSVLVGLREHGLDGILKGKVESLGGEITDDVGQVSTPESLNSLFLGHTDKAVDNTSVTGNFSADNLRVSILGLDEELHTLDRSSGLNKKRKCEKWKMVLDFIFTTLRKE